MRRRHGLDIDDPKSSNVLRALPGRVFSVLELVCIVYAGFKKIKSRMDSRVDLAPAIPSCDRLVHQG